MRTQLQERSTRTLLFDIPQRLEPVRDLRLVLGGVRAVGIECGRLPGVMRCRRCLTQDWLRVTIREDRFKDRAIHVLWYRHAEEVQERGRQVDDARTRNGFAGLDRR